MQTHWLIEIQDGGDLLWRSQEVTISGQSFHLLTALPGIADKMVINGMRNIGITRLDARTRDDSIQTSKFRFWK